VEHHATETFDKTVAVLLGRFVRLGEQPAKGVLAFRVVPGVTSLIAQLCSAGAGGPYPLAGAARDGGVSYAEGRPDVIEPRLALIIDEG
jgi:hypothetical protein